MSLNNAHKVEKLYDTVGFKVAQLLNGKPQPIYGKQNSYGEINEWTVALPYTNTYAFNSAFNSNYGYHAYLRYEDARFSYKQHKDVYEAVIMLVDLGDVFAIGSDATFSLPVTVQERPVVTARAMRILRWMEPRDQLAPDKLTCNWCHHALDNNTHGPDQNDMVLIGDHGDTLVPRYDFARCTYCKTCQLLTSLIKRST